ncbi:MAG: glycoside hydrolase family 31 protein [Lachnospiraceae bacterium]|nr:glycoside hydrolase family 31 protein [Lachnospiraceae bacterium]
MLTATKPKSRRITGVEKSDDSLVLVSEHEKIRLRAIDPCIIRITATPHKDFSDKERPGVINKSGSREFTVTEGADEITFSTSAVELKISRESGSISYFDKDGGLLLEESGGETRCFEEFDTYKLAGGEQKTRIIETADGKKEVIEDALKVPTGKSCHIRLKLEFGDEALYGFGQHEKRMGSLRGKRLYIHQANRRIAVPMLVSTKGYGILIDTYSPLIFNDDDEDSYVYVEADSELEYYFMAGGMNQVIKDYRILTGKAVMPPKWAFGYVQSQERYETQEEILETAKKSRELGLGMDCIVLDWFSWGENQWGQKSYDSSRFPDPAGMIKKLHDEHIHFMISIWPAMGEETEDRKEFAERNLLLPACSVYNAFEAKGRKLYWEQLERTHFSYGTDAWWCDSSEPFTPEWNHRERPEPAKLFEEYCSEAGLRMPYEYSNAYPLYHAMGIYENQRAASDKRVCNLTRSAYTGQQRYGTVMWSGDTGASWDTLRAQVTGALHFSASGLPYWTTDIGAFFVKHGDQWYWDGEYDDTTDDEKYCELFVRWYQLGCFLPVFRAHGTDCRREPWNFRGRYYDALLKANRLRYSLIPYIYSEAGKVWLNDTSLVRFLSFDFADDRRVWDITDQYMFGESLMVCPVLEPMESDETDGRSVREVYFPAGCDWYDLFTGEKYEGKSTAFISADLDTIPVFVKSGSIIPMCEPAMSTEELGDVTFKRFGDIFEGYLFYTDDGDSYAYENGGYTLTEIK